ncbi:MAG: c-type cytochrome [Pseudomonadota bacterium]|nr:c-type cytochrome [Pseudomonadota bacterium]HYN12131.1 c-type cytochrome [Burkholderiales bacterium]
MKPLTAITAALLCSASGAMAQDSPARNLAAACAICHGTEGRAVTKDVIPLAGLPREHIASQMRAFRDGQRQATVMHQIAKGYSDAQIDAMAAWFAAQKR